MCDRIAIIDRGVLAANDTQANLLGRIDNKRITIRVDRDFEALPENMRAQGWERLDARRLSLTYRPSQTVAAALLRVVAMNGFTIADVTTEETTLEDIFLHLTRKAG